MERSNPPRSRLIHQHRARSRRSSGWSRTRPIGHAVDLARHDEIVFVQSLDLLGVQRDGRATPAETDIGVMAFGLGELADLLHEGKRFPEIAESKCALDAAGFIAQLPIGSLRLEAQGLIAPQRRNAAATRRACFLGERLGHVLGSQPYRGSRRAGSDRSPPKRCPASRGSPRNPPSCYPGL